MMNPSLPFEFLSDSPAPNLIQGYISVQGEASVFSDSFEGLPASNEAFYAQSNVRDTVRRDLEQSGFIIIAESQLGFAVEAPSGAYEDLTGGRIEVRERLMRAESGEVRYITHIDIVGENQPRTLGVAYARSRAANIDGILIQRPKIRMGVFPSPIPPSSSRFHLRVPNDVALGLGALQAHIEGFRGDGVNVAMPDSGQYRHPFFIAHGYKVKSAITVVTGTDPSKDPIGHGTGESANIFAVAPDAILQPIRTSNDRGSLVGALSGFMKAKELKPQIITNSWGSDGPYPPPPGGPDEFDRAFALEVQDAIEKGILVIFSAGNGQFGIEPQVPGVLAAGGTYMSEDLSLQASNYTSGYKSPWFEDVIVPTVSGLVGLLPRAQYIMLPIQPGCAIDINESQATADDPSDGTTATDGWALFSGTSAAAPQLAGVAALILGAKPGLKPAQVIEAMKKTALDVSAGRCHPRFNTPAMVGFDEATGFGLVNALEAVKFAKTNF